jgi:hypothetical protein
MLRSPFRFLFLVALLAIFTTPIVAADAPPVAAEPTVASQGTPLQISGSVAEPLFLSTGSGTNPDGTCWAQNGCDGGTPVSCGGSSTCQVLSNGVRCDGVSVICQDYCSVQHECNCWCGATPTLSCSSNSGDCEETLSGITCNGEFQGCVVPCYQTCGPRTPQFP